ncbi:hypothetical protein Zmor_007595 [Zophobas morio]|uniref:Uncharacterized protein n=1 Tax=Zophobas morio TaxID=2755281 RepID=A0AA38MPL8_9CUCU|nr:hypothetical protein Zmor_007595 [Zophobas morio]
MSLRRRKSKPNDEEEIEIDFIKKDIILWPLEDKADDDNDDDDDDDDDNDDNDGDKKETVLTETPQELPNSTSCTSLNVNYDNNSIHSKLSSISSFDGPIADVYRKRRHGSNRFRNNTRTRIEPTVLNHVLDILSICFWKCSTGCQQLPDKQ